MKKALGNCGVPILSVLLTCLFPCAFLYFQNTGEAYPYDILPFFGIFTAVAAAVLLICCLIFRNVGRASLYTDLVMLAVINGNLAVSAIKNAAPDFRIRYILLICAALFILLLILFFLAKNWDAKPLCLVVAIAFGGLILVNFLTALPKLLTKPDFSSTDAALSQEAAETKFTSADRPNVYYLLFDEYAGFENSARYYGYDNADLQQFLKDRHCSFSMDSRNTESCWTATIIPNLMNLNYVLKDYPDVPSQKHALTNPLLFEIFRNNGYQVNLVNHLDYLVADGCKVLTEKQTRETISKILYQNSLFSLVPATSGAYNKLYWMDYYRTYGERIRNVFDCLQTMTEDAKNQPTLTVCYIQSPHAPYVLDQDGGTVNGAWDRKDQYFYLDQLIYTTKQMENAIDNIQANDPNALIIVQSDHGSRYPYEMLASYGGPDYDPAVETPYMQNTLNFVYYKGKSFDIEGKTGINTLRYMINQVFGTSLPELEAPTGYLYYYDGSVTPEK